MQSSVLSVGGKTVGSGASLPVMNTRSAVKYPWREGMEFVPSAGNMTLAYLKGSEISNGAGGGTLTGVLVTLPSSSSVGVVKIQIPFHGKFFGIRQALAFTISGSGFSPTAPIGVRIDGVPYDPVDYRPPGWDTGEFTGNYFLQDPEFSVLIAENLAEGYHVAELYFPHPVNSGSSNVWVIYGFLLDHDAGYREEKPAGFYGPFGGPVAMPTVLTTPGWGTAGNIQNPSHFRLVEFYNSDSSAHTVTVKLNGGIIKIIDVAAGKSATWDPGTWVATSPASAGLKWLSDSALVTYSYVGGFGVS